MGNATASPLTALAEIAAQHFTSTTHALDATFQLIRSILGMRTLFLARVDQRDGVFQVMAAHNEPGGCDLPGDFQAPLEDAF